MLFGVPLFRAFEGVLVAGSRSIFCMELIALTSLILIIFRFFGFSAQNKSYGVLKSKFSVSDRYSVKMILHHVITPINEISMSTCGKHVRLQTTRPITLLSGRQPFQKSILPVKKPTFFVVLFIEHNFTEHCAPLMLKNYISY